MVKERIIETDEGIQDALTVRDFDQFQRKMRDRGWIETDSILESGIDRGQVLEIGSGPGYLGLEWLKKTEKSKLTALEISREMILQSTFNRGEYGLEARLEYVEGNALHMPFEENSFDGAFSNGSLHEWEDPILVFNEIYRVLKPGAHFFVGDMRRDSHPFINWIMKASTKGRAMKKGFSTSLDASYTKEEIEVILDQSAFTDFRVDPNFFGMSISGKK